MIRSVLRDPLLWAHDPMPAMVIDAQWNLLRLNRGGQWLATTLMPGIRDQDEAEPVNRLDLLAHPQGLTPAILNLQEVGPPLLAHLQYEALVQPELSTKVNAFAAVLRDRLGGQTLSLLRSQSTAPVLTTRYGTRYGELAFFNMFTTFGTPQDITLASLRVEHLFAADEITHQILNEQVP